MNKDMLTAQNHRHTYFQQKLVHATTSITSSIFNPKLINILKSRILHSLAVLSPPFSQYS